MKTERLSKKTKMKQLGFALGVGVLPGAAMASTTGDEDPFVDFVTTVDGWATGGLGTGLAILMMIIGLGMGVARNSPLPALSGIAGAAIMAWGPGIITDLMSSGAIV